LGTFAFDDEGVPRNRRIIRSGLFVGYMTSRETASVGQKRSMGLRADGWARIPLIRMTNVSLEPGQQVLVSGDGR
jgi:TldD protein